jgi:hypothetical protein
MIQEYAIEPGALVSWATNKIACRYIKDNFGIGKARFIAEFPQFKNWRLQLRTALPSLDDLSKKRLEELFKLLTETRIKRSDYVYDGNQGWLENAEKEHCRHQFSAILASRNPNNNIHVLLDEEIGDWPEEVWGIRYQNTVQRQPVEMAQFLSPLLQKSQDIIFIDPHFRAIKKKFRDMLQFFLQEAVRYPAFSEKQRVEIQVSSEHNTACPAVEFCSECQRKLPQIIPKGLSVKFKRWKQRQGGEKIHNRYILTNLGGVSFGIGLDAGKEGETDDLNLLSHDQYWKRCRVNLPNTLPFKFLASYA